VYACVVTRPAWRAEDSGHRAEVVFRNFHQASATAPALALGGRLAHEAAVRLRALATCGTLPRLVGHSFGQS